MPVILHFGDNSLEIEAAVRAVRETFESTDALALDGAAVSLPDLSEACLTAGLFEPDRLVMVRNLHDRFKSKGGDVEEIRRLLGSIPPTTTVILASHGMKEDNALVSAVREVGGQVRPHMIPKRADLPRWIAETAQQQGTRIERDAADLMAEMIGGDPVALHTELQKLATYAGEGVAITPQMVEELVGAMTQDSIFTLVDAIAAGDRARALQLLHAQLAQASSTPTDVALYLIRMLARQVRILLRIRLGQEAGHSNSQITTDVKIPRYYADRYFRQARRLSKERLQRTFEQLAALEFALKNGSADPATGLDLLVTKLSS
jgi:DNA polymerase III subunit delta